MEGRSQAIRKKARKGRVGIGLWRAGGVLWRARTLGCGGLLGGEEAGGRGLGVRAAVYLLQESMLPPLFCSEGGGSGAGVGIGRWGDPIFRVVS